VLPGVTVEVGSADSDRSAIKDAPAAATEPQSWHLVGHAHAATVDTTKREGIELASGFPAIINAGLKVGAVEESSPLPRVLGGETAAYHHANGREARSARQYRH